MCGTAVKTFVANVLYEGSNVAQSEGHSAKSQASWLISCTATRPSPTSVVYALTFLSLMVDLEFSFHNRILNLILK